MPDNINIKDSGGTVVPVSTVETTNLNGLTITPVEVQRLRMGYGTGPTHSDVDATHPLPVTDAGGEASLAAILAKLADPATQTTLAAVLAKLSADPATQTTLAAVLAKITGDPSTATNQTAQSTKLDTLHGDLGHLTDGTARVGGTVNTAPTIAGDVAAIITGGRATVATPGTAVRLGAGTLPGKWVCVTALTANAQQVNVGDSAVLAALGSSTGIPLTPGQSATIPIADAHNVYVDARFATDGVSFLVGS